MKRSIHNQVLLPNGAVVWLAMANFISRKLRCVAFLGLATVIQGLFCTTASAVPTFTFDHSSLQQSVAPAADGYRYYQTQLLPLSPSPPAAATGGVNAGTNVGTLPAYITSITTTGDTFYAGGNNTNTGGFSPTGYFADLTANATGYRTGMGYKIGAGFQTLATITLTGTVPSTFQIGVYTNNTDDYRNHASAINLTSGPNSLPAPQSLVIPTIASTRGDFYFFNVIGGANGDVITLGMSGAGAIPLGGLTFLAAVPEPASTVLFGLGAVGLMATYRRRRRSIRSS